MAVARRESYWVHSQDAIGDDEPQARKRQGQRRCARGEHCADVETGEDGAPVAAWAERAFCDRDTRQIARCLTGTPEQWVALHQEIGHKQPGAGDKVSGSRTPPIPLNATIDALLREYVAVLASWDERVRMAAGLTLVDTGLSRKRRDAVAVQAMTRLLAAHLDRLLALPPEPMARSFPLARDGSVIMPRGEVPEDVPGFIRPIAGYADVTLVLSGADAGLEILALHHRGRSLLGQTRRPPVKLDGVPCKQCDLKELAQPADRPQYKSECASCGHLMTPQEYASWAGQYKAYAVAMGLTPPENEDRVPLEAARAGTGGRAGGDRDGTRVLDGLMDPAA